MKKKRILAISPDNYGVGKFRILDPYKYISENYKDEFHVDITFDAQNNNEYMKNYDIVIFHSFIHQTSHEHNIDRIKWLKNQGIKVIMDIDDLWAVPSHHPYYLNIKENNMASKKMEMLKLVDYVTTTTSVFYKTIKDKLKLKDLLIFPNAVDNDDPQFQPNPIESDKIRFGFLGGSCKTPDTEILTENGWVFFPDLKEGVKVATLNPKTNEIEYHIPKRYIKQDYKGDLYVANTKNINFKATGNHNMYVSEAKILGHKKLNFNLTHAEDMWGKNYHFKKNGINANKDVEFFILPSVEKRPFDNHDYSEKKIMMDDWLKYFGFFIAEGWVANASNYEVGICQYKDNNFLIELQVIMSKYGIDAKITRNGNEFRICNRQLWMYLKQFGKAHEKHIPRDLLNNLSERQLGILLEWYLKGDGSTEKTGSYIRRRAYTVSKQLADDLMEIAFKMGDSASIKNRGKRIPKSGVYENGKERVIIPKYDSYQIGFYNKSSKKNQLTPLVRKEELTKEYYEGYVYCVEVENHIIYVRRNGKSMWTGNSHLYDIDKMKGGIVDILSEYKTTSQFVLCGFDLRGNMTEIDQFGNKKVRPLLPSESTWVKYEKIFTDDYKYLSEDYKKHLFLFKEIDYDDKNESYIRRWTKNINEYAFNYNYFDISLSPLLENDFNYNKSQLKVIEAGFHKKAIIASEFGPYTIDLTNSMENGVFNSKGNALLVPQRKDHKLWGYYMKKLITNPNMVSDLGEKLYETVKDKYSLKNVSQNRVNFLKTI
jgi:hypothetical protein